jgi:hypothetical protein
MSTFSKKTMTGMAALVVAGLFLNGANVSAQNHMQLSYNYSIPSGNTKDYIAKGSFRGGSFELRHHLSRRTSVGIKLGLQTFYTDLEKDTYTDGNTTVYGKQFRYLNSAPVLLTIQYNFADQGSRVIPYVQLGAGGCYVQQRTDIGFYSYINDYQWNFGLQPEAGVLIPLGRKVGISAGAGYNYAFGNRSIGDQQYFMLHLGLTLINLGQK